MLTEPATLVCWVALAPAVATIMVPDGLALALRSSVDKAPADTMAATTA